MADMICVCITETQPFQTRMNKTRKNFKISSLIQIIKAQILFFATVPFIERGNDENRSHQKQLNSGRIVGISAWAVKRHTERKYGLVIEGIGGESDAKKVPLHECKRAIPVEAKLQLTGLYRSTTNQPKQIDIRSRQFSTYLKPNVSQYSFSFITRYRVTSYCVPHTYMHVFLMRIIDISLRIVKTHDTSEKRVDMRRDNATCVARQ